MPRYGGLKELVVTILELDNQKLSLRLRDYSTFRTIYKSYLLFSILDRYYTRCCWAVKLVYMKLTELLISLAKF